MRPLLLTLLASLLVACAAPTAQPVTSTPIPTITPQPPTSTPTLAPSQTPTAIPLPALHWAGGLTHANNTIDSILVDFTDAGAALTLQPLTKTLPISALQWDGTTLAFTAQDQQPLTFNGHYDGQQIQGQVQENGQTATFTLYPLIETNDSALSTLAGTYQYPDGTALLVQVSPAYSSATLDFFWKGLTVTDFATGDIRGLYPIAPNTFWVGSARVLGHPFASQLTFSADGNSLTWQTRNPTTGQLSAAKSAQRINLPSETVHYLSSDGITLTGQLTLPPTPDPHPAIVVIHGSEQGHRNDFFREQLSSFFASQGVATLTYDKRGVGDSGGVYVERASESNLTLLAQDALAGLTYLQTRPEINPHRIGLFGSSQGGWIIPIAAQQSADVAFFIIFSGPVVSVGQEANYSAFTNNGDTVTNYTPIALATSLANAPNGGFDPLPILADVRQPGLWLWGSHDLSQPVLPGQVNLDHLIANGHPNFSYVIFPNADHNLQISPHGFFNEIPYAPGYAPDMFPTMVTWLKTLP